MSGQAEGLIESFRAAGISVPGVPGVKGPRFSDLTEILAGDLELERPSVAEALPGKFLLYSGRLNEQHGEPAAGKTNIAIAFCLAEMTAGHTVLFLDPEDNAIGICRKLVSFGGKRDVISERFKYVQNPMPDEFNALFVWANEHRPSLVVLDGLAEALATDGKDEDRASDFLSFCRQRLRPFADCGAAVLVSDHVTKSSDGRGRWSRGTGAKIGRYDGVSYEVLLKEPYTPDSAGRVDLKISKDRNGGVGRQGETVVGIEFTPTAEGQTDIAFVPPGEGGEWQPTRAMQRISEHLETAEDVGLEQIRAAAGCAASRTDQALRALEVGGYIRVTRSPGKKNRYEVLRPYREGDEGCPSLS